MSLAQLHYLLKQKFTLNLDGLWTYHTADFYVRLIQYVDVNPISMWVIELTSHVHCLASRRFHVYNEATALNFLVNVVNQYETFLARKGGVPFPLNTVMFGMEFDRISLISARSLESHCYLDCRNAGITVRQVYHHLQKDSNTHDVYHANEDKVDLIVTMQTYYCEHCPQKHNTVEIFIYYQDFLLVYFPDQHHYEDPSAVLNTWAPMVFGSLKLALIKEKTPYLPSDHAEKIINNLEARHPLQRIAIDMVSNFMNGLTHEHHEAIVRKQNGH